jgi:hypothetical protein
MNSKINKKKEREERIRKQKHIDSLKSAFPHVIYVNEDIVGTELVNAVKKAFDILDFQKQMMAYNKNCEIYFDFLKTLKKRGLDEATKCFNVTSIDASIFPKRNLYIDKFENEKNVVKCIHSIILWLGIYIHKKLDKNLLKKYLPFEFFRLFFIGNKICVLFYKINRHKTNYGGIYTLHNGQKVNYQGKEYEIAYSNHAIERHMQRHFDENPYDCFVKQDNFYETLRYCRFFLNESNPENLLLETYVPIISVQFSHEFYEWLSEFAFEFPCVDRNFNSYIQNSSAETLNMCYTKIFYSPVKFEGNKAVILTNLLPGFKGTPEYDFWKKQRVLSKEDYFMMRDFFNKNDQTNYDQNWEKISIIFYQNYFKQFIRCKISLTMVTKFGAESIAQVEDYVSNNISSKINITIKSNDEL